MFVIAFNTLYTREMEVCPDYISKYNSDHGKQIILSIIPNEKGWHYLTVKAVCITEKNNLKT